MRLLFKIAIFLLLFTAVVVPNSVQTTTAGLLVISAAVALTLASPLKRIPKLLGLYGAGAMVTIVYLLVGGINAAPAAAFEQIIVIYLVSPLLWILTATALFTRIPEEKIASWFTLYTVAAIASVGVFFYLFISGGPDAVRFFKDDGANVNLEDGYAGATMFVYGSLIFLAAGYFAAPSIIRKTIVRIPILVGIPIVAITSGRSALILSVIIGVAIGLLFGRRTGLTGRGLARLTSSPIFLAVTASVGLVVMAAYSGIDLGLILGKFTEEVQEGGGSERAAQAIGLLSGAADKMWMGAGHGIGISLLRNDFFPWRYEMVPLATLYRVGLLGSIIYALPFAVYLMRFFFWHRRRKTSTFDLFMFAGAVSSIAASFTNPYIEAFSFQWMFVFPVVLLEVKQRGWVGERRALRAHRRQQSSGTAAPA